LPRGRFVPPARAAQGVGLLLTATSRGILMRPSLRASSLALVLALAGAPLAAAEKLVLVAGGGSGGDGAPAAEARPAPPFGVDSDKSGNLFLVEFTGHRVRKVDGRGSLATVAGTGEKGDAGDGGPALKAQFNGMHSLAVTPDGDVLVAD